MVIPELHFVQVEGKLLGGDAMVLEQLPLRVAPEAFEAVDMDFAPCEPCAVVDREAAVPAERERIIASKFIRVHQRPAFDDLDRLLQERRRRDIRYDGDRDPPPPLQDAKDRHFAGCAAATRALAPPAEVRLVGLDLPPQQLGMFLRQQRPATRGEDAERGRVAHPGLERRLSSRDFQLKQLDQPQPGRQRDSRLPDPGAREDVEGIAAAPTPVPPAAQSVQGAARTRVTNHAPIFVPLPPQDPEGRGPAPNQRFKGLNAHGTSLILVPDALQSPFLLYRPSSGQKHFNELSPNEQNRFLEALTSDTGKMFHAHITLLAQKTINWKERVDPNDLYDAFQLLLLHEGRLFVTNDKEFFRHSKDSLVQRVVPWSSFKATP